MYIKKKMYYFLLIDVFFDALSEFETQVLAVTPSFQDRY